MSWLVKEVDAITPSTCHPVSKMKQRITIRGNGVGLCALGGGGVVFFSPITLNDCRLFTSLWSHTLTSGRQLTFTFRKTCATTIFSFRETPLIPLIPLLARL